jgi:hypothetical protein
MVRQKNVVKSRIASTGIWAVGALALSALAAPAGAQLLAVGHQDFRGLQGYNGWYYGFFDGISSRGDAWQLDDFEEMPIFDGAWRRQPGVGGYWTSITPDGGHPNGTISSGGRLPEENWAVRRWISDGTYVLQLNGRLWDADPTPGHGNGVIGRIMVDGETVWEQTIDNGNQHGVQYLLHTCTVPGTIIDWVIDPRDNDDGCDDTGFHAFIRTIIDEQPRSAFTCEGGTVFVSVHTLPGTGEYEYQWRFNGEPIKHEANFPTYRVINLTPETEGDYDCVITNTCGSMVSDAARVTICDADFDCDGFVDSRDFFEYLTVFFAEAPRADFNDDGIVNSQDFFDFVGQFFVGC